MVAVGNRVDLLIIGPRRPQYEDGLLQLQQQPFAFGRIPGPGRKSGLVGDRFKVRPAEQGAGHQLDLFERVGGYRQPLQQWFQHALGVDVDAGSGLVVVGDEPHRDPATGGNQPCTQQAQPAEFPHALGIFDQPGQCLLEVHSL